MSEQQIDNFIETYKDYPQSAKFIIAASKVFKNRKGDSFKTFIQNFFKNNKISSCDIIEIKKLAAHWNNVAFDKLNKSDYDNYTYTMFTVINLRAIAHFLENNDEARFNK
jgi:hypothetical protein